MLKQMKSKYFWNHYNNLSRYIPIYQSLLQTFNGNVLYSIIPNIVHIFSFPRLRTTSVCIAEKTWRINFGVRTSIYSNSVSVSFLSHPQFICDAVEVGIHQNVSGSVNRLPERIPSALYTPALRRKHDHVDQDYRQSILLSRSHMSFVLTLLSYSIMYMKVGCYIPYQVFRIRPLTHSSIECITA